MNILWFTWKDLSHPFAGGAERVNEELAKRLAKDGHRVLFLTSSFPKAKEKETKDGYEIIRLGNRYTVYWKAYQYYKKNLSQEKWDIVIDEMNTIPFFATRYTKAKKKFLFIHQLCREIWFHQMPFPFNVIGFIIEPIYLKFLSQYTVITISQSTRNNLLSYGFKEKNIKIISEGVDIIPIESCDSVSKYPQPTLLSLGAIRSMKQTMHQLQAFEIAKKEIPELQFLIAGDARNIYGESFLQKVQESPYKKDITYFGRVDASKKQELMQKSHIIAVTSIKEGWGLIVSEANSQGTPAIVYDVDGLRDSVRNEETGKITQNNNPETLAQVIIFLLKNSEEYEKLRHNALNWSKELTFERSYEDFMKVIDQSVK